MQDRKSEGAEIDQIFKTGTGVGGEISTHGHFQFSMVGDGVQGN